MVEFCYSRHISLKNNFLLEIGAENFDVLGSLALGNCVGFSVVSGM